MRIKTIESSSKGNGYIISNNNGSLLIEAGCSIKKVFENMDYQLPDGCIITHEHKDHCKYAKEYIRKGIDCYCPKSLLEPIFEDNASQYRVHGIEKLTPFTIAGKWEVTAFQTEHDSIDSVGYIINHIATGETLIFITDSYYCRYLLPETDYLVIELNYDQESLEKNYTLGTVPKVQYDRLETSHMSFERLEKFFIAQKNLHKGRLRNVHLIHLSEKNLNYELIPQFLNHIPNDCHLVVPKPGTYYGKEK